MNRHTITTENNKFFAKASHLWTEKKIHRRIAVMFSYTHNDNKCNLTRHTHTQEYIIFHQSQFLHIYNDKNKIISTMSSKLNVFFKWKEKRKKNHNFSTVKSTWNGKSAKIETNEANKKNESKRSKHCIGLHGKDEGEQCHLFCCLCFGTFRDFQWYRYHLIFYI